MQPELGRLLTKSDDYKGCGVQGAVISDGFWQREFGGRADAIGKTLSLNAQPFQIIGVTPASFSGLEPGFNFDVAVPLYSEPAVQGDQPFTADATTWWLAGIGRLKPEWTAERAAAQLNTVAPGIFAATLPADRFARSVSHLLRALETFKALGIDFVSYSEQMDTSTPAGKMVFTVLGAVAELERSLIVERVRAGLRNARAKGKTLGRPRTFVDAARIARLRGQGRSTREIADELGYSCSLVHKTLANRESRSVATTAA